METIKLLYVDDNTDPYISQYLYEEYGYEGVSIEYLQRPFEPEDTYERSVGRPPLNHSPVFLLPIMKKL